jgi:hypothetical protein
MEYISFWSMLMMFIYCTKSYIPEKINTNILVDGGWCRNKYRENKVYFNVSTSDAG